MSAVHFALVWLLPDVIVRIVVHKTPCIFSFAVTVTITLAVIATAMVTVWQAHGHGHG